MMKLKGSVCIDASTATVWAVISELESVALWVDPIERSYCPGKSRGVGAMRVCELKQTTIRETILEWEEGRSFTYEGAGAPMMKAAKNTWTLEARGSQTLVTSTAEVVLRGGFAGRLAEPLVRLISERLGSHSLALLKYLVEHGYPYTGKPRELAPISAVC